MDYVKERKAFGQTIGEFQNTRFKLADVKTQIGLNRALYEQCADEYAREELTAMRFDCAGLPSAERPPRSMCSAEQAWSTCPRAAACNKVP